MKNTNSHIQSKYKKKKLPEKVASIIINQNYFVS